MDQTSRRKFIRNSVSAMLSIPIAASFAAMSVESAAAERGRRKTKPGKGKPGKAKADVVDRWMKAWMDAPRAPGGALHVTRFKERVYALTKPIGWKPNTGQTLAAVDVPSGFVTDFASIPRVFWTLLPPDGEYTYPAIVHDWMYWNQERPREEADMIFKLGMQDFGIDAASTETIYRAVRTFGGSAWNSNARLKARGEKRILKEFPSDPRTTWEQWKRRPNVFAP
jgi:hypothetical protein